MALIQCIIIDALIVVPMVILLIGIFKFGINGLSQQSLGFRIAYFTVIAIIILSFYYSYI